MPKLSHRTEVRLKKYAKLVGGIDADGFNHTVSDQEASLHIFAVKNTEMENSHWTFVTGRDVKGFIRDDIYDIDYVGHQKMHKSEEVPEGELTKAEKEFRKKFLDYAKKQEEDRIFQDKCREESIGVFDSAE